MHLALALSIVTLSYGHSSNDATFIDSNKRLFETLFQQYYSQTSPYNSESNGPKNEQPAEVRISIEYAHLTHVVEVQMSHNHVLGLRIQWQDPRLAWKPEDFNGINYIYVRESQVWIPEIAACESSAFIYASSRGQMVKVNSTGHAEYFFIGYAAFICEFDIAAFPFDSHWCFYCFALPDYSQRELVFSGGHETNQIVMDTSEWSIDMRGFGYSVDLDDHKTEDRSTIYFEFLLKRRSAFWVYLIITPSFLIGFLILLGLFFSSEGYNVNIAVNLGLIAFTSMTFIIGILADSLPKAKMLPILGMYIVIELAIITVAVLSVFHQATIRKWADMGVKWFTKDDVVEKLTCDERTQSAKSGKDRVPERRRRAPLLHRMAIFASERVIAKGLGHFIVFMALHVLNLAWLMAYGWANEPERPETVFRNISRFY